MQALASIPLVLVLGVGACQADAPPRAVAPVDSLTVDSLAADSLAAAPDIEPDTLVVQGVGSATARLEPVGDSRVSGTVRLRQLDAGVRIQADLDGLRATRLHAFQILRGDACDADPEVHLGNDLTMRHGAPERHPGDRHLGDLGNIRGGDGDGRYDRIDPTLSLNGTHSPVGRAVVVRAAPDDGVYAESGGEVLACGVARAGR